MIIGPASVVYLPWAVSLPTDNLKISPHFRVFRNTPIGNGISKFEK